MSWRDPRALIFYGFLLVLTGFVLPFLMVMGEVKASLVLSFLSYGASIAGLFLGLIGAVWYSRLHRGD
jgi:hypothetical protein